MQPVDPLALIAPPTPPPAPVDRRAELPTLPPHGVITPEIVDRFLSGLRADGLVLLTDRRPDVWAAYLTPFTLEELRCLYANLRDHPVRVIPSLEVCLCRLHHLRAERAKPKPPADPLPSSSDGPQALTRIGEAPSLPEPPGADPEPDAPW